VSVPAGACDWATDAPVVVDKEIILQGAGTSATIITTSGTSYAPIVNVTAANVTVMGIRFNPTQKEYPVLLAITATGFRVTGNYFYADSVTSHYGIFVKNTELGLIDTNTFNYGHGSSEFIQSRGPCDAWTTATGLGGSRFVFVENNIFETAGYLDMQADSRTVFRHNTITGNIKFDAHQYRDSVNEACDGQPQRGARAWEVYNNYWTRSGVYTSCIDTKGGTGVIYGNRALNTSASSAMWFYFQEYCARFTNCADYTPGCACAADYPVLYQIGRGQDQALEPAYMWDNSKKLGANDWGDWAISRGDVSTCATSELCGESFAAEDIIQNNRDYYLTQMPGYAPYTYPHPLRGARSGSMTGGQSFSGSIR
jgi:hypothetical protein